MEAPKRRTRNSAVPRESSRCVIVSHLCTAFLAAAAASCCRIHCPRDGCIEHGSNSRNIPDTRLDHPPSSPTLLQLVQLVQIQLQLFRLFLLVPCSQLLSVCRLSLALGSSSVYHQMISCGCSSSCNCINECRCRRLRSMAVCRRSRALGCRCWCHQRSPRYQTGG